jgi:hypothetical protein
METGAEGAMMTPIKNPRLRLRDCPHGPCWWCNGTGKLTEIVRDA